MKRSEQIMNQLGLKGISTIKEINKVSEQPIVIHNENKDIIIEEVKIEQPKQKLKKNE